MTPEEAPAAATARERGRVARVLAYAWFSLVMWATAIFPDFRFVQQLRGFLVRLCFRSCGRKLLIARDVTAAYTTNIDVGTDVWIAKGVWILGYGGIKLGDQSMLGPYSILVTGTHTKLNGSYRHGEVKAAPIVLERGVSTGAHAVITAGVTVGEGALVAAGTVVTVNVPAHTTITGVPGRVIKPPSAAKAESGSDA